jgi:hypothetical protein
LNGETARAEDLAPELRQVQQRRGEARRRDDLVRVDGQVATAVGAVEVRAERTVREPLDRSDRRVEHGDPSTEHVVLVRLDVAGADADERAGVDREGCR